MYSKEEASRIRKKFWVSLGHYMKLQESTCNVKVNWINYKTGIKGIEFKTDVTNKFARIAIEMKDPDIEIQALMFEQFEELKPMFHAQVGEDWIWFDEYFDEFGKQMAMIELKLDKVSVFRETDWPEIIRFLKNNLLKLDEFWCDAKEIFEIFK